jgi:hypothetical protein
VSTMRLSFHHATGHGVDVDRELELLDEVYGDVGVTFQLVADAALNDRAMKNLTIDECNIGGTLNDDHARLFALGGSTDGIVTVFFVESMNLDGCALHPPGMPGVVVIRDHADWVLAHEIGHVFGLPETFDPLRRRLMHVIPAEITSTPTLIDEEVRTIRGFSGAPRGVTRILSLTEKERKTTTRRHRPYVDVRPDTVDLRDRLYVPHLQPVPSRLDLEAYTRLAVPVLDQGPEGACTGYALATVIHYLLRVRPPTPDLTAVSPHSLFEMARRYDDWADDRLPGASLRATLKGWQRHGAVADALWREAGEGAADRTRLDLDGAARPLGAYFRVPHVDLTAMHSALRDTGALVASAAIHKGWRRVERQTGLIPWDDTRLGNHAFGIVGYDERGFWIQNSWGERWGRGGLALLTYDDWLRNGLDAWAVQLGVKIVVHRTPALSPQSVPRSGLAAKSIVAADERGRLRRSGLGALTGSELSSVIRAQVPRPDASSPRRLLLHVPCAAAPEPQILSSCRDMATAGEASDVAVLSILWASGMLSRIEQIAREALAARHIDAPQSVEPVWRSRWDDSLEALTRPDGRRFWQAMKKRGVALTADGGGACRLLVRYLTEAIGKSRKKPEIHLSCDGTGSLVALPLIQWMTSRAPISSGPLKGQTGPGLKIASVTLWSPACTHHQFDTMVKPAIDNGSIARLGLFTLTPEAERTSRGPAPYGRSLLRLVSAAFEHVPRRGAACFGNARDEGTPILGLADHVRRNPNLRQTLRKPGYVWRDVPAEAPSPNGLLASTFEFIKEK